METNHVEHTSMVRWQFQRGTHTLTCRVEPIGTQAYDVITLPHWDMNGAAVERFEAPKEALQRHAMIAAQLRDAGWKLAAYTD
jgi:hypothetical protein